MAVNSQVRSKLVGVGALGFGLASRLRSIGEDTTMAIIGGLGAAMMFGGLSTAFAADAHVPE
jgi:hypothetical protein